MAKITTTHSRITTKINKESDNRFQKNINKVDFDDRFTGIIDKVVDDFRKQGIKLGIKQAEFDAALEMIKQNSPINEIEDITGIILKINMPDGLMPGSVAAKQIKKGFEHGLSVGKVQIAKKMVLKKFSDDCVSRVSGLSIKEISIVRRSI